MTSNLSETPNNRQRAVEVLNRHWSVAQETQQDDETACCVQALADAGLLMPDLPEPGNTESGAGVWEPHPDIVILDLSQDIPGYGGFGRIKETDDDKNIDILLIPADSMRSTALALLAAAEHMEKNE